MNFSLGKISYNNSIKSFKAENENNHKDFKLYPLKSFLSILNQYSKDHLQQIEFFPHPY